MHIPFSPPYIDDAVKQEVMDTLNSGWITTGPKVKALEQEIALFCGVEMALGVNSATSAMMLVLHWLGIKRGDEVIIPAYTYCATALAVMHVGAVPVMVDVQHDFNIDVQKIKEAVTVKTKAIITVDFGGWPCDYDAIYALVNSPETKDKFIAASEVQHSLGRIFILSDAAHSLGAVYKNKPSGALADVTVFSLHAVKNITSAEGGIICLNMPAPFNNQAIYKTMRLWSLNGQTKDAFTKSVAGGWQYDIVYPGFKINLPDVLAAIGLAQFRQYKSGLLPERERVFKTYNQYFSPYPWALCPAFEKQDCLPSYHLYPLRIKGITEDQRNEIIKLIAACDVAVNVHFTPLPMLTIFKERNYDINHFPSAYQLYANEISLPVYPQLTPPSCEIVAQAVIQSVQKIIGA